MQAKNTDPLIAHEDSSDADAGGNGRADGRLRQGFLLITLPVLILHGTADKATRPSGSQRCYETAGSRDKTLKLYDSNT